MDEQDTLSTHAFRMQLLPGCMEEYRRRHDAIWPALQAALLEAGIVDYRIFHDAGDDALFAVLCCREPNALAQLPTLPVMRRWWAHMADIMATEPDLSPQQHSLQALFVLTAEGGRPCVS